MKIIHTADWHLGKLLENESRLEEQALFCQDFIDLCDGHEVDVVIIAGDVYDTGNPPAKAEALFYQTLKKLSNHGQRLIIVISGNHDSPMRLAAAEPLACEHGILMATSLRGQTYEQKYGNFEVLSSVEGGLRLKVGYEELALVLLPYPSEQRLGMVLSEALEETEQQRNYSEQVKQLMKASAEVFTETSLNLVVTHVFVGGSEVSESERPIQVGGGYTVFREAFPESAHYVALGHLHRPQEYTIGNTVVRYAGSPLQYSKSEIGYTKSVTLIETRPTNTAMQVAGQLALFDDLCCHQEVCCKVSELPLHAHKPLFIWRVQGVENALEKLTAEKQTSCWVYLEIQMDRPLRQDELKALKDIKPDLLAVMPILPGMERAGHLDDEEEQVLDLASLFAEFHRSELGAEADEALMSLFLEIAAGGEDDEADSINPIGH